MKYLTIENLLIFYFAGMFVSSLGYYWVNSYLMKFGLPGNNSDWSFIKWNTIWPVYWTRFWYFYFIQKLAIKIYNLNIRNLNIFGDELKREILLEIKEESLKDPEKFKKEEEKLQDFIKVLKELQKGNFKAIVDYNQKNTDKTIDKNSENQ